MLRTKLPPAGWILDNPDDLTTWGNVALAVGANGKASRAWRMDYYYYDAPGQVDRLISPVITLAGSAGTHLKFHHAYKPYGASYTDGLRVEISTNCGANWTQLYYAAGAALATAPQNGNPFDPTAANQWVLNDIDLSAYDGQAVVIRFVNINDYGNRLYLDNITLENNGLRLAVKLMLEGPYDTNTGRMRDQLRTGNWIPAAEPYTGLAFTQASDGGGETMQAGVAAVSGDNAIVDWVLVELRNQFTPAMIAATRVALVQRDGDVVAEDGVSPISLLATANSYYVAVRHRNHLGCMTSAPISLSGTTTAIDFSASGTATYGTNARKDVNGTMVLWTGNAKPDATLRYAGSNNDRDPILVAIGGSVPTATVPGYRTEDTTMDGLTKYAGGANDRDVILVNIGGSVPTATRAQQLP
ncbi:MAG: choice-of-anchor J domain-containing protein [Flavobacteriales bacterium]|nr:choice-of-anchor J domain-containing protein [Flavobacteriales bacterium]